MRKSLLLLSCLALPLTSVSALARLPAKLQSGRPLYVPGEVVVKYRTHISKNRIQELIKSIGARETRTLPYSSNSMLIRLAAHTNIQAVIHHLRASGDVQYAEPNYYRYPLATRVVPNDPAFTEQWGLDNTGVIGVADADIDMPEAWSILHDAPDVTVAIIDDGFDFSQADLNDGNYNAFVSNGVDCSNGTCSGDATATLADQTHGTLVAGSLGAIGNNHLGTSGVVWRARILPIKIDFKDVSVAAAIDYAVAHNARIINLSLGGPTYSDAEFSAIQKAMNAGVLVIASAGNDDSNTDRAVAAYPANYPLPNILAVAASDVSDKVATFSQWGSFSVDLIAPGVNIWTAKRGGGTASVSGTSFSSPLTAGVAALVAENLFKANGTMPDWREIKAHLLAGAEMAGSTGISGFKGRSAAGRVNANNALQPLSHGVIVITQTSLDDSTSISSANDGDNEIDAGETDDLTLTLDNAGNDETDVQATLKSLNSYSTVDTTAAVDFGPMAKTGNTDATAQGTFRISFGNLTDNESLLFELDITSASGASQIRYFYLEAGHLDNGVTLTQTINRTNWDDFQAFHFNVPAGASDLIFYTHSNNGIDIDLLAKYNAPPEYEIALGQNPESPQALFFTDPKTLVSGNADGEESISVPSPSTGTYHLVIVNFALKFHNYQVTACYAPAGSDQISFAGNAEVNEDGGSVNLTVLRSGTQGAVSVHYQTVDGTAIAGTNYQSTSGTLNWADGDNSAKTITIKIINTNSIPNQSSQYKNLTVDISTPTGGASLGCMQSAPITIMEAKNSSSGGGGTPPPAPNPGGSGGGGGGGAPAPLVIIMLAGLLFTLRKHN